MIQHMRFFIGLTLFLLIACSKPTDGYWDWPRRCDLNNRIYTDVYTYNKYCNEEHAYEVDIGESIMREWMSQPRVEKNCNVGKFWFQSTLFLERGWLDVRIIFDSLSYHTERKNFSDEIFFVEVKKFSGNVNLGIIKYNCHDLLPLEMDSLFTDATCTDTLGLRSVIDVFVNFPDSLCEEQPNN